MTWRALWLLLLLSSSAWGYPPGATADMPDPTADACDYEDTTTGEAARVPVIVDTQRGQVAYGYRVCRFEVLHWPAGAVRSVRMRSVRTSSGEVSDWTVALIERPSAASVELALVGATAAPPPPPPPPPDPPPMASISENGTSVANFSVAAGVGLASNGSAFVNSGDSQYDASTHNTSLSTGNHSVSAVIGNKGLYSYVDLRFRHNGLTGGSEDCWQISVGTTPSGDEYYITEVNGGVQTTRASGTTTFSNGAILSGEGDGTTIRLKLNGSTIASYTSSQHQSNVKVGAGIYRVLVATTLDDFAAQDIGGSVSRAPISPAARIYSILLPNF